MKVSKSFKAQKGQVIGYEQFAELLRAFIEKTDALDENHKVTQPFKIVIELDTKELRGNVPEKLQKYLDFKDNTFVRTVNDHGEGKDAPVEDISVPMPVNGYAFDEEVDGPVDQELETVEVKPKKKGGKRK